jgi:hypothetical protein
VAVDRVALFIDVDAAKVAPRGGVLGPPVDVERKDGPEPGVGSERRDITEQERAVGRDLRDALDGGVQLVRVEVLETAQSQSE